jgi:3',5'-cyclic-AMP phosphodiesterase
MGLLAKPAFMIHTGDITHLSKPGQFDDAENVIGEAKLDVHYVPGEHDVIDEENGKAYLERYGKNTKGTGWYSFDAGGVHFIGLVNVANLKAGGMGSLGDEQLAWLADDLKGKPTSTPVVVFAHIPLWTVYTDWGWGTEDSARALALLKRFGSVTVLNGHIHQLMQKVEGNVMFHTAMSTSFPQPAPGTAASPGPMLVPAEKAAHFARADERRGKERKASPRDHRFTACRKLNHLAKGNQVAQCDQKAPLQRAAPLPRVVYRRRSRRRSGIARSRGGHGGEHR